MVFVTVGSQKFPFDRLLCKVDELIQGGVIREEVIAQTGTSGYQPRYFDSRPFYDRESFEALLDRCEMVIAHGGAGTISNAMSRRKKIIVVPRLARYGEHVDDHQLQLMEALGKRGFLCPCPDLDRLAEALEEAKTRSYGECLSFVDADDFAEPQLLERMYRRLTEAGADVCACGAEGIRIKDGPPGVFSREEAVRCLARSQPFGFVPWGKLYRTALVKDCPFDEGIFYSEDLLFLYQLFQRVEKVCYLPDRLYHYVCREGGQMQSGINRRKCTALAVNDRICEDAALRFPEAETDFRQTALAACRCLAVLAVKKGATEGRLWDYLKLLQGNLRRHFSWKALARCPRKKDAAAILALSVSAAAFWGLAAAMGKGGQG